MQSLFDILGSSRSTKSETPNSRETYLSTLNIPRPHKFRSKSDSTSPFANKNFDEQKIKSSVWNDENFTESTKKVIIQATSSRSPLQDLGTCNALSFIPRTETISNASTNKVSSEFRRFNNVYSCTPQSVNLHSLQLPLSSKIRSKSESEKPIWMSSENISSAKVREKCFSSTASNKCSNDLFEQCYSKNESVKLYAEENLNSIFTYNASKMLNICVDTDNMVKDTSDMKLISVYEEYMDSFDALPPTENIGDLFWVEDNFYEVYAIDTISLDDMVATANIWNFTEENECKHLSPIWSLDVLEEPKILQDPFSQYHVDLQDVSIEFPWHEVLKPF